MSTSKKRNVREISPDEVLPDEGLMAPDDLAEAIMDIRQYIIGDRMDPETKTLVPRFGLLSLKARSTPMYVYDHPALKERFPTTFSDGAYIFVNADFMRTIMREEDESDGEMEGMVPLLLHNLTHLALRHHKRAFGYPDKVVDIGCDISVNSRLLTSFPEMRWVPSLVRVSPGASFPPRKAERYSRLAEETIMREIMELSDDASADGEPQDDGGHDGDDATGDGPGKPGGKGSGAARNPSADEISSALEQMGAGGGEAAAGEESSHTIPVEQFSEMLDELGIESTKEALEIPDVEDSEAIDRREDDILKRDIDNVQKAVRLPGQRGAKAGKGILEGAAYEMVERMTEGKVDWKLGLQQMVIGEGMEFSYQEETPGDLYYVDPSDMSLSSEVYIGEEIPMRKNNTVLVMVDTSGSVTADQLELFFSEIVSLKNSENPDSDQAAKVIVIMADSVIRGEPLIIDEHNVDEFRKKGIEAFGRGGTDIAGALRAVPKLKVFKEENVKSIVYFTDLEDLPPKKSDVPKGVALAFMCPPDTRNHHEFVRAVREFARVYPIRDDVDVDLSEEWRSAPQARI